MEVTLEIRVLVVLHFSVLYFLAIYLANSVVRKSKVSPGKEVNVKGMCLSHHYSHGIIVFD